MSTPTPIEISDLPASGTVVGTDLLILQQSDGTKKLSIDDLPLVSWPLSSGSGTTIGDTSVSLISGDVTINSSGNIDTSGNISADGNIVIDGTASFGSGTATIDSSGDIVAAKVNKVIITAPASTATLTIDNNTSLHVKNVLALSGTNSSELNIAAGGTLVASAFTDTTSASNISTGTLATDVNAVGKNVSVTDNQFSIKDHLSHSAVAKFDASNIASSTTRTYTLPDYNATLATIAGVETLTNKTYDTAGTGNVFKVNGTQVTAVTGTGSVVLANSPTLVNIFVSADANNDIRIGNNNTTACCNNLVIGHHNSADCGRTVVVGYGVHPNCDCTSAFGSSDSGCIQIVRGMVILPDGTYFCNCCYSGSTCCACVACCSCSLCGAICCACFCCDVEGCCNSINTLKALNFACVDATCSCSCCHTGQITWDGSHYRVWDGAVLRTLTMT